MAVHAASLSVADLSAAGLTVLWQQPGHLAGRPTECPSAWFTAPTVHYGRAVGLTLLIVPTDYLGWSGRHCRRLVATPSGAASAIVSNSAYAANTVDVCRVCLAAPELASLRCR